VMSEQKVTNYSVPVIFEPTCIWLSCLYPEPCEYDGRNWIFDVLTAACSYSGGGGSVSWGEQFADVSEDGSASSSEAISSGRLKPSALPLSEPRISSQQRTSLMAHSCMHRNQVQRLFGVEFKLQARINSADRQWRIDEFCSGGGQQIQLRTESGDLGTVAP